MRIRPSRAKRKLGAVAVADGDGDPDGDGGADARGDLRTDAHHRGAELRADDGHVRTDAPPKRMRAVPRGGMI